MITKDKMGRSVASVTPCDPVLLPPPASDGSADDDIRGDSAELLKRMEEVTRSTGRLMDALTEEHYDDLQRLVAERAQALEQLSGFARTTLSQQRPGNKVNVDVRASIAKLQSTSDHVLRLVINKKSDILHQLETLQRRVSGKLYNQGGEHGYRQNIRQRISSGTSSNEENL